jgi:hypothetical protein
LVSEVADSSEDNKDDL